ncbi:Trigger factor [Galdieria sulphuraria]|nr:Trigger factor [Galdieria sulphuraria]
MERGNYMEGLKEGLIGAHVGETVSIPLKFPDNAKRQDLRGISAIFDISIKELKRKELPPLDDSLVKNHTHYSSSQELRDAITKQLEVEIHKVNDSHLERALEDSLAEIVELEIPQQVAEEHSQRKFANLLTEMKEQGETWTATLKELKVWFALQEIARREQLVPNNEEVAQELKKVEEEMNEKEVDWAATEERIQTDLKHSKTIDFLKDHARIEYISNENI